MPPVAKKVCVCVCARLCACAHIWWLEDVQKRYESRTISSHIIDQTSSMSGIEVGNICFCFVLFVCLFLRILPSVKRRLNYLNGPSSPNMLCSKFFSFLGWIFHLGLSKKTKRMWRISLKQCHADLNLSLETSFHCYLLTVTWALAAWLKQATTQDVFGKGVERHRAFPNFL